MTPTPTTRILSEFRVAIRFGPHSSILDGGDLLVETMDDQTGFAVVPLIAFGTQQKAAYAPKVPDYQMPRAALLLIGQFLNAPL